MSEAKRDENRVTTTLGVSSSNSNVTLPMEVDETTNFLLVDVSILDGITVVAATDNKRDENRIPTMYGVDDSDGETLIPIRTDDNGVLLVQFT